MNSDEIYERFGISSRLAHGLMFQSVLVIFATIISIWGIFELKEINLRYITNIISLIVCISLLIYSFYGFNAKRNQELFFITSVILYIVLIISGLFTNTFDYRNPTTILTLITLISTLFFLHDYAKSYRSANYALFITVIASAIIVILSIMDGMHWYTAIKYIIIPVTIALTYFERVQRGKYLS